MKVICIDKKGTDACLLLYRVYEGNLVYDEKAKTHKWHIKGFSKYAFDEYRFREAKLSFCEVLKFIRVGDIWKNDYFRIIKGEEGIEIRPANIGDEFHCIGIYPEMGGLYTYDYNYIRVELQGE